MGEKAARPHMWTPRRFFPQHRAHETSKLSSLNPGRWAAKGEQIDDSDALWRQYVILGDLYRYYVDLIWKVSIWYYSALGLSLAYLFSHLNPGNNRYLPLLLIFLAALSAGIGLIFSRVVSYVSQMEEWLEHIAVALRLPGRPHVEFIQWFCRFTGGTLFFIAVSCIGLFAYLYP
jgi:hypothetical protein